MSMTTLVLSITMIASGLDQVISLIRYLGQYLALFSIIYVHIYALLTYPAGNVPGCVSAEPEVEK